ncbi:coiled-coil domain-containing protein 106-like isoform X1 [Scomber scombrus]|uniref:Coiled-coil domain-containing protein 106-like isoform X1 n=1 Tax=Scomber scombrus TaxID=13677 RepID=A0AAV1P4U9_SCOSC
METRGKKRGAGVGKTNERPSPYLCSSTTVTIQNAQSEDEAGMQPKTKKAEVGCSPKESLTIKDAQSEDEAGMQPKTKKAKVCCSPNKSWSPTGASFIAKLKEENKLARIQIQHLEERVKHLEQANMELKKDKDFLLSRFGEKPGHFRKCAKQEIILTSSTSPEPSSSSSSDGPFSSKEEEVKKSEEEEDKKKRKETKKPMKTLEPHSRSRMTTVDGVIRRYKEALKRFKKSGSMKRSFEHMGVDRNTIARTAPIAELYISFSDVFKSLSRDEHEKISTFTERLENCGVQQLKPGLRKCKCVLG